MPIRIPLTRGLFTLVDDEDAASVLAWRWHANPQGGMFYAVRWLPAHRTRADRTKRPREPLHRFILSVPSGVTVDHIDRDPLNNCRANLRVVTRSQNMLNRACWAASGLRGVIAYRDGRRFTARIHEGKVSRHLGIFATAEDAARAYDAAASRLHGPFARLNFPNENGEPDCTPLAVTEPTDLRTLFPHSPLLAAVPQHKEQPT